MAISVARKLSCLASSFLKLLQHIQISVASRLICFAKLTKVLLSPIGCVPAFFINTEQYQHQQQHLPEQSKQLQENFFLPTKGHESTELFGDKCQVVYTGQVL